tara:strand:+ start:1485 stop:2192 length:708 start_codon:yes stop_codon:yes gene_type:complete
MIKITNISPNYSKTSRKKRDIKFVVIHYTGMQSEIESINRLKNPKAKVSCHYLINRKGHITQMVKEKNISWHAGKSKWKKFVNLNKNSLGIELVNKGHRHGYQNFTNAQIRSLLILCKSFKKKYKIKNENFLGHSDIAPLRKQDPGEKFSWKKLSEHGIGKWFRKNTKIEKLNMKKKENIFFKNLKKIGYRYFSISIRKKTDKQIVKCFQRHYLPKYITGKIDKKTLKISQLLAN